MINNNIHNIFSSNIAPNPLSVKYWADLSEDPSGSVIKTFKNGKWVKINDIKEDNPEIDQIKSQLNNKVDKVEGKSLSTNDYTTEDKNKLSGIQAQANKTTVENVLTSDSTTNALSAAQGKRLNELIEALTARVVALETPLEASILLK